MHGPVRVSGELLSRAAKRGGFKRGGGLPDLDSSFLLCPFWDFPDFSQGQISAQGILRFRNPNLGPNSGKRISDARILDARIPGSNFLALFFPAKEAP